MSGVIVVGPNGLTEVTGIGIGSNAPRATVTGTLTAAGAAGAAPAAGSAITLPVDGFNAVVVQLAGTWAGTVAWFGSVDGGATYFSINMIPFAGGLAVPSTTGNGVWETAAGGLTHLQAVMTAFTSGSAAARAAAANGLKSLRVTNPAGNPLTTTNSGSPGVGDYSAAQPAASTVQAMTLLATIPANPARLFVEVQNQSTGFLTMVRDDGTSNTGLGTNATVWLLNPYDGQTANTGGGSWSSQTFKGRVRIYGASGAQVGAYQD